MQSFSAPDSPYLSGCDSVEDIDDEDHVRGLSEVKQARCARKRLRRDAVRLFERCSTDLIFDNVDNPLVRNIVQDLKDFEQEHDMCHHGSGECFDMLFKSKSWTNDNLERVIALMRDHLKPALGAKRKRGEDKGLTEGDDSGGGNKETEEAKGHEGRDVDKEDVKL